MLPLVCVDVDGTLVGESREPTEAVWRAAAEAIARGQHLAISTGRGALGQALDFARRLDPDGWHIFHNGAALLHTGSGEVRAIPLAPEVVAWAAEVAERNEWVIEYYAPDDYTVASTDPLAVDHAALLGVPHVVREVATLDGVLLRLQFVVPAEALPRIRAAMADMDTIVQPATSPSMPGVAFVSCTARTASKGQAIARIAAEIGTGLDRVMMVGDGLNDVEAIAAVGHGVAMGNAVAEAKSVSRHVVADVEADGLVEALALSTSLD